MGKSKAGKGGDGIPQRHLHARISYLYQASHYLSRTTATRQRSNVNIGSQEAQHARSSCRSSPGQNQSRHLVNQLRGVARKSQIRLGRDVKHSICKRCGALLSPGQTSSQLLVNDSKGSKKPWADVYEVRCLTCQVVKRFPAGKKPSHGSGKLPAQDTVNSDGEKAAH